MQGFPQEWIPVGDIYVKNRRKLLKIWAENVANFVFRTDSRECPELLSIGILTM